jgi:hypothetical protein
MTVIVNIEVSIPDEQVSAFVEALDAGTDDILLEAQDAMARRLRRGLDEEPDRELELDIRRGEFLHLLAAESRIEGSVPRTVRWDGVGTTPPHWLLGEIT